MLAGQVRTLDQGGHMVPADGVHAVGNGKGDVLHGLGHTVAYICRHAACHAFARGIGCGHVEVVVAARLYCHVGLHSSACRAAARCHHLAGDAYGPVDGSAELSARICGGGECEFHLSGKRGSREIGGEAGDYARSEVRHGLRRYPCGNHLIAVGQLAYGLGLGRGQIDGI